MVHLIETQLSSIDLPLKTRPRTNSFSPFTEEYSVHFDFSIAEESLVSFYINIARELIQWTSNRDHAKFGLKWPNQPFNTILE